MITLSANDCNPVSQEFYDKTLSDLQFHLLTCTCAHSGCLIIHGYYNRRFKVAEGTVIIRICRVKCTHCGKTHALLLSSFVPYSQILRKDHISILSDFEDGHLSYAVMEQTPSIDENNLRYIILQYLKHWKQRLLAAAIPLLSSSLTLQCFSCFGRPFMQIKKTSNILFPPPT